MKTIFQFIKIAGKKILMPLIGFFPILFMTMACDMNVSFHPVKINFNDGWKFIIVADSIDHSERYSRLQYSDSSWTSVQLPHTPGLEPLLVNDQWQGICWYRKHFDLPAGYKGKKIFIRFEAAMNVAEVWINGKKIMTHLGGYLPFCIDASKFISFDKPNVIAVRLDNRDNKTTGPKPLSRLDFNTYGGIYRNVWLEIKNPLHITDPILAGIPAGGGIFVTYPDVSRREALIRVQAHVANEYDREMSFKLSYTLLNGDSVILHHTSGTHRLKAGETVHCIDTLRVNHPQLWSPRYPDLYTLKTGVLTNGKPVDEKTTRIGIRKILLTKEGCYINGEKMFLRGVNRHQEYPFIGYALSDNAQYRDARKIKEAGFDFVRLSHYPQSPAFMDACDELGILTLDAIPGWQYFGDEAFRRHTLQTCRDMIRRDRNHACVLAWEVSLNETTMPLDYIREAHRIAHEEYPGPDCYSAGWVHKIYDVYIQARQHRLGHDQEHIDKPYLVSEYGDWEYYAMNAGLNQDGWKDLLEEERSSRQLRAFGEKRLLQQALNAQEAHNDNYNTPAFADAYWVMFDYNRGYADDLEASGVMDIFRLPKFSYYFFRSQRDADETGTNYKGGPVVFIANYWTEESPRNIKIFSNCEEVSLSLNGQLIGRQTPLIDAISCNLDHAPFVFETGGYVEGKLEAIGYIDGREVARHTVRTPGQSEKLELELDESGKPPEAGCKDVLFLYIFVKDHKGAAVPVNGINVELEVKGDATILNTVPLVTEAGIATALVRIGDRPGPVSIVARSKGLSDGSINLITK